MCYLRRSLAVLSLTAVFTLVPITLVAQQAPARSDPNACPPSVMPDWEIMASGLIPYGMMEEGMAGEMMGPGMLDYGLPMHMPDGGLMMEVMEFQPNRVLALQRQLRLEPNQMTKLEKLVADRWDAEESMRVGMEADIKQLRADLEVAEPDTALVRRDALKLAAERDALYADLVVNAAASCAVLTPQQEDEILTGPCGLHRMSGHGNPGNGRP